MCRTAFGGVGASAGLALHVAVAFDNPSWNGGPRGWWFLDAVVVTVTVTIIRVQSRRRTTASVVAGEAGCVSEVGESGSVIAIYETRMRCKKR